MSEFIAVDWGTTNRRAYRISDGRVVASEGDDRGVKAVQREQYEAEIAGIRERLGDLPMRLVGMVGSTIGWRDVPYVRAPASLETLAAGLCWIDSRTAIVPGIAQHDPGAPDVMRGEEVQIFGALAAGLIPADAIVCQPGTHCKWATLRGGMLNSFLTAMTGELFALLSKHSVLAAQLAQADNDDRAAFQEGVIAGSKGDLLGSLFRVRAAGLLGFRPDTVAASYASGLLIGADVAARDLRKVIHVLADPELGDRYALAIAQLGGETVRIESEDAFVAGVTAIEKVSQ